VEKELLAGGGSAAEYKYSVWCQTVKLPGSLNVSFLLNLQLNNAFVGQKLLS